MMKVFLALLCFFSPSLANEIPVWFGTGDKAIYKAAFNQETGVLGPLSEAASAVGPSFLAIHPKGRVVYAVERQGKKGYVAGYRIEGDGNLTEIARASSEGAGPCHVDVSGDGKILLVANYGGGTGCSYLLNEEGAFSKAASVHEHEGSSVHPRQKAPHPHGFFVGPKSKFGYLPDLGIDEVVVYGLNGATGEAVKTGSWTMPPGTGPRHLKISEDGKHIYVLGELTLTVVVGNLDADGLPAQTQVIDVLPPGADKEGMTCSEIRIHPNGQFVYVAARDVAGNGRDALTVYSVGGNGQLTRLQTVAAEAEVPRNINLDPSGKWLLVAAQQSNEIAVFSVGADGTLKFTGQRVEIPKPMCVLFGE